MDTKKLVILVLVVIAVLCAMAIGAGLYQGSPQPQRGDSAKGSLRTFFRSLTPDHTTLEAGRLHVVSGCTVSGSGPGGKITVGGAPCNIVIGKGRKSKPQVLRLEPFGSTYACFKFSAADFASCPSATRDDSYKFDRASSFTVGRDSAFLRLYCSAPINPNCFFTVK